VNRSVNADVRDRIGRPVILVHLRLRKARRFARIGPNGAAFKLNG
jgi:hypothetical protein